MRPYYQEEDVTLYLGGSGATLLAARNGGRKAIGVETEERFAEVAARRLASPSGIPHVQQAALGLTFEAVASGGAA